MKLQVQLFLAVCVLIAAVAPPAFGQSALEGKVVIDGSSTVYPISEAIANDFRKSFPKVNVTVAISGTGGGFKRFTKGETDISDASRPIKAAEFEQCKQNGIHFVELPVAYDGLSIVVNKQNDWVDKLTVEDLQNIFLEKHAAKTWKQVNSSWPDTKIDLYAPGTDSGTFDYFKEVVSGKSGDAIRADMSVSEDDNVLVTGVAAQKGAIGFFGCAYYFENEDKLRAVPIVNDEGKAVSPAPEAIESGEYNPFARPLFIYVNIKKARRPELKKFVQYYLENAPKAAERVGYVALPAAVYKAADAHFKNRYIGTHFLTEDGEKKRGALPSLYKSDNRVTTVN